MEPTSGTEGADRATSWWTGCSHDELVTLCKEFLLAGHLMDRSGMPHLIAHLGREGMAEVAIAEWRAASPIYTRRMQRLLGFEGSDVETIFKGIQLDIGAPPEFMDFRFSVRDPHYGEFALAHCGALMDVEPMGDEYVTTMCHDIEDPTFDATAAATNGYAQVRPVHRPPRTPRDRSPHCAWSVTIDETHPKLELPPECVALQRSKVAGLPIARRPTSLTDDDGTNDYSGPLQPDLDVDAFSSATLAAIIEEVALQGHLLSRAYLLEVHDRTPPDVALAIGISQATGIAGLTTKRLAKALGLDATLPSLARLLSLHPMLMPSSYVSFDIADRDGAPAALEIVLRRCPATDENDGLTWPSLLTVDLDDKILRTLVTCLIPTAATERVGSESGSAGALATWRITVDEQATPRDQPEEVTLTEFSTGAAFEFGTGNPQTRPTSMTPPRVKPTQVALRR